MSVLFEFHVRPTDGCLQASMIARQFFGSCVTAPWTSTQISTPASAAAVPHSTSARPICSNVFCGSAPFGTPFGRTFTPLPPRSATSRHELLAVLDVLRHHLRVGRVELAHAAAAPEHHAGVGELLLHVGALFGGQRWFDAVLVRRAALHGRDADLFADAERRRKIPPSRDVVRHEAEFDLRAVCTAANAAGRWRRGRRREVEQQSSSSGTARSVPPGGRSIGVEAKLDSLSAKCRSCGARSGS